MNSVKTVGLLTLLTVLLMYIGRLIGGPSGMMMAFMFAIVMNFVSYWYSDKIVLAMYKAQEIDPSSQPELYEMVERLAKNAGIPTPRLFYIPEEQPNAFATGRNPDHAVVAVTAGILRALNKQELEGVLAHELSHVKNRDILIGSMVATVVSAISMIASMARWASFFGGSRNDRENSGGVLGQLVLMILAPIMAMLIQMAISRTREYMADASGGVISGDPLALASALKKISEASRRVPMMSATPATAHMFIVNNLSGGFSSLFSTHPPMEERVRRLEEQARRA